MISSRHISKIAIILVSIVFLLCVLAVGFSGQMAWVVEKHGYSMEYEQILFNTEEVLDVNIIMDQDDWNEMLENARDETYYKCDVVIGGTRFYDVGIRPKGNTSLSAIASDPDNNRYSFKLEFDCFVEGQTCFGLDKLVLNNNYADTTNMKEALIYDMFQYLDADASLYNYAEISVNNEYWGVYLALEAVEESFMLRNYGAEKGYLYKPDSMNQSGGNKPGGMGHDGGGANLNYTDDDPDSYSAIWSAEVNPSTSADHKRVIEALKNVHAGNNIEKYIDVEQVLKYMAVHNFSVNEDSLSGSMAHNYYLYEANGQISILPWDYNLAFGGMKNGSGTEVVNDPIDEPYSSTELFDFVLENEAYRERYHEYYNRLITEYFNGGRFDETYQRIRSQIDELVRTDPNALYSYEEYTRGAELLYELVTLRAESIAGQLNGSIPSTEEEQRADSASLIEAGEIKLSDLGQFMGGGGGRDDKTGGFPGGGAPGKPAK